MRLKLTLQAQGRRSSVGPTSAVLTARDLVVTVGSSTTIGELASYLVRADPESRAVMSSRAGGVGAGGVGAGGVGAGGVGAGGVGGRGVGAGGVDALGAVDAGEGAGRLTLTLVARNQRALDPQTTLPESGLRSGVTVAVTRLTGPFVDPGRPVVVAAVVAGPDSGKEFPLWRGTAYIGRGHGCEVQLSDTAVSRRHAKLLVGVTPAVPEVVDLGSANGISIGGAEVARASLAEGDRVTLGDTEIEVRPCGSNPGAITADEVAVSFSRSPRIAPIFVGREFDLPELPERPKPSRLPWLAMMLPALMGMAIFAYTHSPYSLLFVAMSPMMMLGNHLEQRRGGKKEFASLMTVFREDLEVITAQIRLSLGVEALGRRAENPSSAECAEACRTLSPLLWTRRGDMPGFLQLRLGLATLPSRSSMTMPEVGRSRAEAWLELAESVDGLSVVPEVPVVVDPLATGAIGVSGRRSEALPVARSLVLQAASLHSPAELVVTAFASSASAPDWDWLKWLPHTTSSHSPIRVDHLACTAPTCSQLLSELEDLVARADEPLQDRERVHPRVIVLVEDDAPVERSRLVQLAERGWRQGICVLWVAPTTPSLPAACRVFVEVAGEVAGGGGSASGRVSGGGQGAAGYVKVGELVTPITPEGVSPEQALSAARSLAPVEDSSARGEDDNDLPRAVSLLDLAGPELASSPDAVIERWGESRSILTGPYAPSTPSRRPSNLRAIVGQSAQGTFSLDLRADGPHALVGGTTGSGKSELLQAWILGMASAHSPQRVTFLLVDYKGGSAFRDCVDLPHTVGLVTDLSPHLVRRALASLSAELRHRERLLAEHQAKDLVELERRGEVEVPPSLVIIVDEFAALSREVPEFVEGVVNIAQRGRSLGLHLILATQRPAGVIKDNLRANTNLRLALRMADENDSSDVLGSTVAASFDPGLPGRAVSRSGPTRLTAFQTAYAGGWTSDTPPPPEVSVEALAYGLGQVWEPPMTEADLEGEIADTGRTDIQRLVSSIGAAAETAQLPRPRVPWLPELRRVYDLADLPTARRDDRLVFGVADDPEHQDQPVVAFSPDQEGNLAVFGASGSGKSAFLRSIAVAAGLTVSGSPCQVYGIDFGNRGLSMLELLPHVGSIVPGADHERLTRLLLFLRRTIDSRALRYSRESAATITDHRRIAGDVDEARILVLVDGLAAFRQAYESGGNVRWMDLFISLAADGRPVGVHFVISVDQRTGLPGSLASSVQSRVVLRMAHADDYSYLGVPGDVLSPASPPGRGLLNGAEIQCAVAGGSPEVMAQAHAVEAIGDALRESGRCQAEPIGSLSQHVLLDALPEEVAGRPVLGVGSTTLAPMSFEPRGSFVVTGPSGSGRTTSLASMARSLHRWNPTMKLYLLTPKRSSKLASLAQWTDVAAGPEAIVAMTSRLLAGACADSAGQVAIVIERVDDLAGTSAELSLSTLVKTCLDEDHFVVAEGETMFFSSSFGLSGLVKTSRSGLALQPEGIEGQTVFRSSLPAFNRSEMPPGRGFLLDHGRPELLQVALPQRGVLPIDSA